MYGTSGVGGGLEGIGGGGVEDSAKAVVLSCAESEGRKLNENEDMRQYSTEH